MYCINAVSMYIWVYPLKVQGCHEYWVWDLSSYTIIRYSYQPTCPQFTSAGNECTDFILGNILSHKSCSSRYKMVEPRLLIFDNMNQFFQFRHSLSRVLKINLKFVNIYSIWHGLQNFVKIFQNLARTNFCHDLSKFVLRLLVHFSVFSFSMTYQWLTPLYVWPL